MHAFAQPLVVNRKNWVVLLAMLVLAVGYSLQSQLKDIRAHNESVLTESARNMFQLIVLTRLWNASTGSVYAVVGERAQPNPYLKDALRDITDNHGRTLTMINPAYMTRQIADLAKEKKGVQLRITSLHPTNPVNEPDAWERQALQSFAAGSTESISMVRTPDAQELHRYMAPLRVEAPCLKCHADQGYQLGDVRGGISITQSYTPFELAAAPSRQHAYRMHGLIFLLVALCGWWLLEQLRRRWTEVLASNQHIQASHEQLLQSEKMASLGRMVAGFSHEINTPIGVAVGAISNSADTIAQLEALLVGDEIREDALRSALEALREADQLASANLQRAARLIQSFKRTSVDQTSDETRVFELAELSNDTLAALHNQFKHTQIRLSLDCPDHVRVNGRPGLIEQVLTNLLVNSLTHGFQDGSAAGTIRIQWRVAPGRLYLTFSDDGQGMPEDARQQVFEPFFTTRRNQGGSGLGLYICYNIISVQLQGTISCQSAPGQGTVFTMEFPAEILAS